MSDKPPFDTVKASFYLVALVISVHCLVVLAGMAACLWAANEVITGRFECDKSGRLIELLSSALAAALAFAGGSVRKKNGTD